MEVGARRGARFQLVSKWIQQTKSQGSTMKTKRLGNSDLFVTPVGFGGWAIGGSGWEMGGGGRDEKAAVPAIHSWQIDFHLRFSICDCDDRAAKPHLPEGRRWVPLAAPVSFSLQPPQVLHRPQRRRLGRCCGSIRSISPGRSCATVKRRSVRGG